MDSEKRDSAEKSLRGLQKLYDKLYDWVINYGIPKSLLENPDARLQQVLDEAKKQGEMEASRVWEQKLVAVTKSLHEYVPSR
jgi:hypothetical protein